MTKFLFLEICHTLSHHAQHYCTISINSSGTVTHDAPDENMVSATSQFCRDVYKNFGSLALQAMKNFYIRHMITKWFCHFAKMAVTIVTFCRFWKARDAWLTNWLKWYSMICILEGKIMWWMDIILCRGYCTISIDLSGGVTYDTAVEFWYWGHLQCDLWQTKFMTNILNFDRKFIHERDEPIS